MEWRIFGRDIPTEICGPPPEVIPNIPVRRNRNEPFYLNSDRNFRNLWHNGKHPKACAIKRTIVAANMLCCSCCVAILVYCSVRDCTRICYVIEFENIRIPPSTRIRVRWGFIFFPLWLAVEFAGWVWTEAVSRKKKLPIQKYPEKFQQITLMILSFICAASLSISMLFSFTFRSASSSKFDFLSAACKEIAKRDINLE